MQIINCHDLESLISVVTGLTKAGLTFKACTDTLTITLTGGY